jgi:hypothetical protein
MSTSTQTRTDGVSKYYDPAVKIETTGKYLFALIAIISLYMPFSSELADSWQIALKTVFITIVSVYFVLSQVSRFYLLPRAERRRRKQLLADAFGTALSLDKTTLYYNNEYAPSLMRLGANTMENSLFSKEIAAEMLCKSRFVTAGYAIMWLVAFTWRHNNLDMLISITQLVFSGEILAQWINLELLRSRHERTFEQLHTHFLHEIGQDSQRAIATILDAFVEYESAKSSAGLLLSSKVFEKLNPTLTSRWEQIRKDLKMNN